MWSITAGYETYQNPPQNIRSIRIVSRDGATVHNSLVKGVKNGVPLTIQVDMASVKIDRRLDFDIVLSTWAELYHVPNPKVSQTGAKKKPKRDEKAVSKLKEAMSPLLKDISTMNMAFTFGLNGSARNVALWAHQSILSQQPSIAALIKKLKDVEAFSGVKSTHVTEYSLEAYCAVVRYLYTNEIQLEVDLDDFAIGCPPNKPLSGSCKNRPTIDGLFDSQGSSSTNIESGEAAKPRLVAEWSDLFQIADCYEVTKLREHCLEKIVETLDTSTALDVLFGFAYRYPDLKVIVLQYVADNMSSLYAASQDPFADFEGHSERQALLAEVLQIVFKAKVKA
ncbi:hypothetical protein BG000_001198 [Podila horticola]|nr:hypothetical protein BG000_001198 [Podila horticola]